jgi:hypothetical protein
MKPFMRTVRIAALSYQYPSAFIAVQLEMNSDVFLRLTATDRRR